jgi:hypothetical protein
MAIFPIPYQMARTLESAIKFGLNKLVQACYHARMKTRLFKYFTIGLFILACLDVFIWRYEPGSIKAGQSFVYWSQVEQTPRAWLFLPFLALVGIWLFWRKLYLSWISAKTMLLLIIAMALLGLVAPFSSLTTIARHLQSAANYRLYYQYEGIGDTDCDYILVRCDGAGLVCDYAESWQVAPLCLGNQAPIRLETIGKTIRVFIFNELVYEE